jgi:hypothetical protein
MLNDCVCYFIMQEIFAIKYFVGTTVIIRKDSVNGNIPVEINKGVR